MKQKKTTTSSKVVTFAIVGASLAALAATAYFFLGPDGKKHQRHTKAWVIKMKAEIIEKLEQAREVSQPMYDEIIDSVAAEYTKAMSANHEEIRQIANDLKNHWKTISRQVTS
jgi:hypothetical protein